MLSFTTAAVFLSTVVSPVLATPLSDAVAQLRLAPTAVDRINALSNDKQVNDWLCRRLRILTFFRSSSSISSTRPPVSVRVQAATQLPRRPVPSLPSLGMELR
jgi:hypothetical protein